MTLNSRKLLALLLCLLLFVIAACGGGGGEEPEETAESQTTEETVEEGEEEAEVVEEPTVEPTATPEPSNVVTDLQSVNQAVVQIVAEGTFVDPQYGLVLNQAGSGTGFIIDESGLAVTNNHVVTGAAFLEVYVTGEDRPRNAKVLGVSECSDLALIDIDGDGFTYLEPYGGDIQVGLDVYAAGYPLGDPEYTLTRGIVSKESASGETNWASIDAVLEHDATINPGNSGGPLVTTDGQVVGVNYAGIASTGQFFSITWADALPIIETLQAEQDVNSIGINGTAVLDEVEGLSGIWVASVESGSAADNAGVKPGDIITSMEGLILGTDGTMSDYCDILRTNNADSTMSIEVLRFDTQEVLEGQLNGRVLETTFSFAQTFDDDVPDEAATNDPGTATGTYTDYYVVTDDSGSLTVEVPTSWGDVDGSPWLADDGSQLGWSLVASPDNVAFDSGWDVPGIIFFGSEVLADLSADEVLDTVDFSGDCAYDSRSDYDDSLYTGRFDVWDDCGGVGTVAIVIAAYPEDRSFVAIVAVAAVSDADLDALDRIIDTFQVLTN